MPAEPDAQSLAGRQLGSYRILERLGAGGMGAVYRAHDDRLDRALAIKVLQASGDGDPETRARLLREARAAAGLNHPHVCTIYEVGEADGQSYIAMELIEGDPLSARLAQGPLGEAELLRYGAQLADALDHAHQRHVVHRDFKSANVIVTREGRAKVLDFGLAKRLPGEAAGAATTESALTAPGTVVGTLAYMAPEQLRGLAADARSDIWALGVVLHEMAAGVRPFQGQTGFELSSAILSQPPAPLPPQTSASLRAVVTRCLEKEPARRYQRASEVRAAVEAVQTGTQAPAGASRPRLPLRPGVTLALAAIGLALALVVGLNLRGARERLLGRGPRIESLAVLPLKNLSPESGQDYFADGFTEEVVADLSKIGGLKVISRTSAMRYRNTDKSLPQIAKELGVDGVIEGSIRREGDRVRITVQLIDGPADRHLWAETYQRDVRDTRTLTGEIAQAVARELKVTLTPQEQARLAAARPVKPEAYEAYLKGRARWDDASPGNYRAAQEYFELALAKDPGYALAYAGIAANWMAQEHVGLVSPSEAYPKMRAAALKATELDDALADAHLALASVRFYADWDWSGAAQEFVRPDALSNQCTSWRVMYLDFLFATKRFDAALADARRCLEVDPFNPFYQMELGMGLGGMRRYDESIAVFRKLMAADPNYFLGHYNLWGSLHYKHAYAEAWTEARKAFEALGDKELAHALGPGGPDGYRGALERAAATLAARSRSSYVPKVQIAQLYSYADDKDPALDWLERAYAERESNLVYLAVNPDWDSLRGEARFQDLLRRMKLGP